MSAGTGDHAAVVAYLAGVSRMGMSSQEWSGRTQWSTALSPDGSRMAVEFEVDAIVLD